MIKEGIETQMTLIVFINDTNINGKVFKYVLKILIILWMSVISNNCKAFVNFAK
ncbi:hypothetical protein NBC122_01970 [Chryseobacterium salivictor]|uniref:Uncharacterized protein n=1 Tax=Chryseobacterium salivictor TaxID=2547600 RepID=A0A4P6ZGP0_9FLAO|nr:hypothetical protein NBC122_01970 [Chryseobacterium salivictor]